MSIPFIPLEQEYEQLERIDTKLCEMTPEHEWGNKSIGWSRPCSGITTPMRAFWSGMQSGIQTPMDKGIGLPSDPGDIKWDASSVCSRGTIWC